MRKSINDEKNLAKMREMDAEAKKRQGSKVASQFGTAHRREMKVAELQMIEKEANAKASGAMLRCWARF